MSDKTLVLELYPRAACTRFPVAQPTARATRFIIKLSPGSPRFAAGNTAAQAWRRAYENITADAPKEKRALEITLRLSQSDVLVVRKRALERLAAEETRCARLDGRVVEVVIQEYLNWLNDAAETRAAEGKE
jgi:hypothetical protein